jgi:hypothetical protein
MRCHTLLCLSIQTGRKQTGDTPQIARGTRLNGRAARFANMLAFIYGRHRDFLMQPLPDGDTAALHPRRADREPCR